MVVAHPPSWAAERAYAARALLGALLGLEIDVVAEERRDTELRLDGRTLALADGLFALPESERLTAQALPREPLARRDGLPVLWPTDDDVGVDVLGGSFFMLTRLEEVVRQERDEHDRFPAAALLAARERFLDRPLVDEYAELLWQALARVWPRLARRPSQFRLAPSHDVDWPLTGERTLLELVRRAGADALRAREPRTAARRVVGFSSRRGGRPHRDVNNTFEWIMDASERRGLRSTFFFIAGRRAGRVDGDYSLDDPWIRSLLRRMHERRHEIGLHTSYTTYRDETQTRVERDALARACADERIEQEQWGVRQHYLRWRAPETWRNCAGAALDYDASVGFAEELGFRSGTCHPYPVFDVEQRRELPLRELPLVAMEGAALDRLALDDDEAVRRLCALKDTCRRFGGTFTLLWHNSRLVHARERRLYEAVLDG